MFSAKSGGVIEIHNVLSQVLPPDQIHTWIFDGMGEDSIRARSANMEIKAQPLSLRALTARVNHLIANKRPDTKQVVFIEEATFFATDPDSKLEADKTEIFMHAIQNLQNAGYSVVLIGLNNNYRGEALSITQALEGLSDDERYQCSSYHLHSTPAGNQITESTLTSRYSTFLDMYDFLFPILVPRDHGVEIEYTPIPEEVHPLRVIRECDPELFTLLNQMSESELLARHTQLAKHTYFVRRCSGQTARKISEMGFDSEELRRLRLQAKTTYALHQRLNGNFMTGITGFEFKYLQELLAEVEAIET
jgi:hypothetical protein